MDKEYYTVREAAEILGVTRQTIYNWITAGVLDITQKVKGGAIRIHRLDIPTFVRKEKSE
jgi:excisionase family DNA binding protein|tara:strand:+ start:308 stop:487 length:180 start_codon:yes stop_codon:yes gene_type:complete